MIAWVDTETTGLGPSDSLLEFVCIMTDDHLRIVDSFGPCVIQQDALDKPMSEWPEIVQEMHAKNGLIRDLQSAENLITLVELDENCADWLEINYKGEVIPLAGSTIGFDRAFMKRLLPKTERFFHYRSIDISSVKELCKRWNKLVYDLRPTVPDEDKVHRALPDLHASIQEAEYYRDKLFQVNLHQVSPFNPEVK